MEVEREGWPRPEQRSAAQCRAGAHLAFHTVTTVTTVYFVLSIHCIATIRDFTTAYARQVARIACANCHPEISRAAPQSGLARFPTLEPHRLLRPLSFSAPLPSPSLDKTHGTTPLPTVCIALGGHGLRRDSTSPLETIVAFDNLRPRRSSARARPSWLLATIPLSSARPATRHNRRQRYPFVTTRRLSSGCLAKSFAHPSSVAIAL